MGAWGPGLYSNDMAEDLRPLVGALSRLPMSTEQIVELAIDECRDVANDPDNEDHTTFWSALADQLHRAGISAPDVFKRAQTLVRSGADADMMRRLGMVESDVRKRSRQLAELAQRLDGPPPARKRKRLAKPQPLLMQAGDVIAAPLSADLKIRNPYLAEEDFSPSVWVPVVVISAGHALGYLAVYCLAVLREHVPTAHPPSIGELEKKGPWQVEMPGTCTPMHFKRMQLRNVGRVRVDPSAVSTIAPEAMRLMQHFAVHDVSIANRLDLIGGTDESFETLDALAG